MLNSKSIYLSSKIIDRGMLYNLLVKIITLEAI
ncbi:hypothetical protein C3B55_00776 [Candidatus Pseudomonas adelgestsugas]|uniref:Uncharacterized protein n=1 Tax=Candidatus Pseudomonas adelgestsugas TaxID=1302376 RepID=A0ABX5R9R7_9PSED|nr:hypothetical protein C3B55_00776 [Candidatus Pseudomonas adelgestsugas]